MAANWENIFPDSNKRQLKRLWPLVKKANGYAEQFTRLSDFELRGKTNEFKLQIHQAVAEIEAERLKTREELRREVDWAPGQFSEVDHRLLTERLSKLQKAWLSALEGVLDEILPEAFAVVKETCRRMLGHKWSAGGCQIVWDLVPNDTQLLGGIVLHRGNIVEVKTGEGKTLIAVAPAYLNALVGRGVHIVTSNSYLAERDAEWVGPIYEFLGLTVNVIVRHQPHSEGRKEAYRADITYGTSSEFGFDYLRDNSFVTDPEQLVQREHHYAIIHDVDSVLIDEARTPLIISRPVPQTDEGRFEELKPPIERLVYAQQKLVASLAYGMETKLKESDEAEAAGDKKRAGDLEQEAGLALLRATRGFPKNKKLQKLLQEPGVARLLQQTEFFYLQDNAKHMSFVDEVLYFVVDEKQRTIELREKGHEFITREAGRESGSGLEQEKFLHVVTQLLRACVLYERDVDYVVREGKVLLVDERTGSILPGRRYSNGLHQALEAKEDVEIQVSTQACATITLKNYLLLYHKLAVATGTAETNKEEFREIYGLDVVFLPTHRSVTRKDLDCLVFGTKREMYSAAIERVGGYHRKGQPVLVSTTSTEATELLSRTLTRLGIPHNVLKVPYPRAKEEAQIIAAAGQRGAVTIATKAGLSEFDIKLGPGVCELGGLAVIGVGCRETRRADIKLRCLSGLRGDPGESQFYISLEDDLMRLFGSDRMAKVMDRLGVEDGAVITHPWVNKSIERAQKKVEQNSFAIHKRQIEYDDILNAQREIIYERRQYALLGERLRGEILEMIRKVVTYFIRKHYDEGTFDEMRKELLRTLAIDYQVDREGLARFGEEVTIEQVFEQAQDFYHRKREALARPFFEGVHKFAESDAEQKPERVVVNFTDGHRSLRVAVLIQDALETRGQEVNDALERVATLSTIDERWTEHLRELDELKEGIRLRGVGQHDPLIEYKMEAHNRFETMLAQVNTDVASFLLGAGPLDE